MSEPFVGEIQMFGGNFAPRGWAFCDGQLLAVSQNDALFSLLGTIYGGDGRTTFGLPELRGRLALHAGSGPGLTPRRLGAKSGNQDVTLTETQLPSHTHTMHAEQTQADSGDAAGRVLAELPAGFSLYDTSANSSLSSSAIGHSGGSQSHTNMMPSLCINYIIALTGTYPSRH